jgi:hypothetical protein
MGRNCSSLVTLARAFDTTFLAQTLKREQERDKKKSEEDGSDGAGWGRGVTMLIFTVTTTCMLW